MRSSNGALGDSLVIALNVDLLVDLQWIDDSTLYFFWRNISFTTSWYHVYRQLVCGTIVDVERIPNTDYAKIIASVRLLYDQCAMVAINRATAVENAYWLLVSIRVCIIPLRPLSLL